MIVSVIFKLDLLARRWSTVEFDDVPPRKCT